MLLAEPRVRNNVAVVENMVDIGEEDRGSSGRNQVGMNRLHAHYRLHTSHSAGKFLVKTAYGSVVNELSV